MDKFTKLPSGKWNKRVYDYTDEHGRKHTKSFTASSKAEIKQMIAEWKVDRLTDSKCVIRLSDALQGYIDLKESVLSPSTIRAYKSIKKNHINGTEIGRMEVNKINTQIVQKWISDFSKTHSPKTTKNVYGLFTAVMEMYAPEVRFKATLPQRKKEELYCPNEEDVSKVLEVARSKNDWMTEFAIMCAAFIPARAGEICALCFEDISDNIITISKSMVHNPDNSWTIKAPKTYSSYRAVEVPQFVFDMLPHGTGRILDCTPDGLSARFRKYLKIAEVPHFRFHDLRHYGASMLLTTMSPRYVQERGGWASDYTMNRIYNNVIDLEKARQTKQAMKVFEQILHKDYMES